MDDKEETNLAARQREYEKHLLVEEYLELANVWQERYAHVIRAVADAFGEEHVLDSVERVWWDMAYEVGLSWRERFEQNPAAAVREKVSSWHDDALWARICCCDVSVLENDRWELKSFKCYREIFNKIGEQKIGMSWCMTDFAAVRGWSPNLVMRHPLHLLRGDNHCHQIRYFTDDDSEQWDYSRETSEKVGWRSVKLLDDLGGTQ